MDLLTSRQLMRRRMNIKSLIQTSGMRGRTIVACVLLFGAAAEARQTLPRGTNPAKESPVLIVGSEQEYPPFSTGMTDETAGGFTVELWRAVAREQGLKFRIRVLPFDQLLDDFKAKRIDVMINLARTQERRKFAEFTTSHSEVKGAVFVRKSNVTIHKESDIRDQKVILLSKDLSYDYALSAYPGKSFILVRNSMEAFSRLAKGEADAFLLSKVAGMVLLKKMRLQDQIEARTPANFKQEFCFAVQKGSSNLKQRLDEGLTLVKASGEYDAIYEKWFGPFEEKKPTDHWTSNLKNVLLACGLLLATVFYVRYQADKRNQQEILKRAEANFRAVFQTAAVGMVQIDQNGRFFNVNQSACRIFGYSQEEFLRLDWRKVTDPDDIERDQELFEMLIAGEIDHFELEKRYKCKDGNFTWNRIHSSLTTGIPGDKPTVLTVIQDINYEIENRIEIINKEARYRGLLNMAMDPTLIVGVGGEVQEMNEMALSRLELSRDETHEITVTGIDEMLSSSHLSEAFHSALLGEAITWEGREIWWKNKPYRVDVTARKIDLSDAPVVKLSIRDSTERYQMSEQIHYATLKMELALRAGKIGFASYAPGANYIDIDERFAEIFGWQLDSKQISVPIRTLLIKLNVRRNRDFKKLLKDIRDNPTESHTLGFVDSKGINPEKWVQIRSGLFFPDSTGKSLQLITCFDISEQIKSEREAKEISNALVRASGVQENFIAKLSHELRTPLNVILGFGKILQKRSPGPEDSGKIDQIVSSGEHLLELINDLLLLSDSSAAFDTTKSELVNIFGQVKDVCELLEPLALGRGVQIEMETPQTGAEFATFRGDARSVRQIILNVIDNAVKYNVEGGKVSVYCSLSETEEILVIVKDTGVGLSESEIQRVFVPFYRGWAENSGVQGTGLGLPITRELIENMGGRISVESEVGSGASFTLAFPKNSDSEKSAVVVSDDASLKHQRLKLTIIDCLGSKNPSPEDDQYDLAKMVEMRESVLAAFSTDDGHSILEVQIHTNITTVKQLKADAFILIALGPKDMQWLQELRRSAVTRKVPCFVLLPKDLSVEVRETMMADASAIGEVKFVRWTSIRQLSRDCSLLLDKQLW